MTRRTGNQRPGRRAALATFVAAALVVCAFTVRPSEAAPRPRTFVLNYCWGTGWPAFAVCPSATMTLYSNHTVFAVDDASGATGSGQWNTARRSITFTFPGATYSGTSVGGDCYQGTMQSPSVGGGGSWRGCYAP